MLDASMAVARCYECSVCGGLVREAAPQCAYCGSSVATVRCGRCFMMNVPEALHCIGCGAELGLQPVPSVAQISACCPRCKPHPLDAFADDGGLVYDCGRCGGQFVLHNVLAAMIARHQTRVTVLPKRLQPNNPLTDPITYRPCPVCDNLMLRRNFGRISGVIVDVCAQHGVWFDCGELPRILAFVTHGGLQQTQLMEREEKRWTNDQVHQLSEKTDTPCTILSNDASSLVPSIADMEDAARAFVQWVRSMLP